jgi:hypothetical protein
VAESRWSLVAGGSSLVTFGLARSCGGKRATQRSVLAAESLGSIRNGSLKERRRHQDWAAFFSSPDGLQFNSEFPHYQLMVVAQENKRGVDKRLDLRLYVKQQPVMLFSWPWQAYRVRIMRSGRLWAPGGSRAELRT